MSRRAILAIFAIVLFLAGAVMLSVSHSLHVEEKTEFAAETSASSHEESLKVTLLDAIAVALFLSSFIAVICRFFVRRGVRDNKKNREFHLHHADIHRDTAT